MYIELTKKIHEQMASHQFVVSIMGNLNQEFLKSLIRMTDHRLTNLDANDAIKKKIFHFMVECAQNLCRSGNSDQAQGNSLFLIGKKDEEYSVFLGSVFNQHESRNIIEMIAKVNALTAMELKEQFYNEMAKAENRENHLLMSLLDLSKRTREKIHYDEFSVDDSRIFLSFKITL